MAKPRDDRQKDLLRPALAKLAAGGKVGVITVSPSLGMVTTHSSLITWPFGVPQPCRERPEKVIMVSPMAVVVVLMVPMSLVHSPAFSVVVIMRMTPVCSCIWRTVPAAPDPPVMVTHWFPVSVHPDELWTWRRSILLIADRRWRGPDVHRNLC